MVKNKETTAVAYWSPQGLVAFDAALQEEVEAHRDGIYYRMRQEPKAISVVDRMKPLQQEYMGRLNQAMLDALALATTARLKQPLNEN
jgi:hypothetical protein